MLASAVQLTHTACGDLAIGSKCPDVLVREYTELFWKTQGNISPLYQLDSFDYAVLIFYFTILGVLAVYGAYRIKQVTDFWRYRRLGPRPRAFFTDDALPHITVQLPLFNELYVVERLLRAVTAIDYPRAAMQIQVLDDSTDETQELARRTVDLYAQQGFDIEYVHRTE